MNSMYSSKHDDRFVWPQQFQQGTLYLRPGPNSQHNMPTLRSIEPEQLWIQQTHLCLSQNECQYTCTQCRWQSSKLLIRIEAETRRKWRMVSPPPHPDRSRHPPRTHPHRAHKVHIKNWDHHIHHRGEMLLQREMLPLRQRTRFKPVEHEQIGRKAFLPFCKVGTNIPTNIVFQCTKRETETCSNIFAVYSIQFRIHLDLKYR